MESELKMNHVTGLEPGVFATFWNQGKITPAMVQQAIETYRTVFGVAPAVLVAGAQREAQARDAATACGLNVTIRRGGLLAGEFWLGGGVEEDRQPTQLTLTL